MDREPVDSSVIASLGHDPATNVLEVEFHHGGRYRYFLVPRAVYDEVRRAPSVGEAFRELVRDRYRYERL